MNFFNLFFTFLKIRFLKKIEANCQSLGKFLSDIESCYKKYSKLVTLRLFLKTFIKIFRNIKQIEKIHKVPEKLINSFEMKKNTG